jgi:hypothetical protein
MKLGLLVGRLAFVLALFMAWNANAENATVTLVRIDMQANPYTIYVPDEEPWMLDSGAIINGPGTVQMIFDVSGSVTSAYLTAGVCVSSLYDGGSSGCASISDSLAMSGVINLHTPLVDPNIDSMFINYELVFGYRWREGWEYIGTGIRPIAPLDLSLFIPNHLSLTITFTPDELQTAPVPEPASYGLAVAGLLVAVVAGNRRSVGKAS